MTAISAARPASAARRRGVSTWLTAEPYDRARTSPSCAKGVPRARMFASEARLGWLGGARSVHDRADLGDEAAGAVERVPGHHHDDARPARREHDAGVVREAGEIARLVSDDRLLRQQRRKAIVERLALEPREHPF